MNTITKFIRVSLFFALSTGIVNCAFAREGHSSGTQMSVDIPGYVVHGINNYNGEPLVDYSGV